MIQKIIKKWLAPMILEIIKEDRESKKTNDPDYMKKYWAWVIDDLKKTELERQSRLTLSSNH